METDQEARLRLFLQEYEVVCKRYDLVIESAGNGHIAVFERYTDVETDALADHLPKLKERGIRA